MDEILPRVLSGEGKQYCIYGDSGYNQRWFIDVPFQGSNIFPAQCAFNKAMSSVRISVDWIFKEVKLQFSAIDFKRKMKVREHPVGMIYLASILLSNFRNCLHPNQMSRYFDCPPPDLTTYVNHRNKCFYNSLVLLEGNRQRVELFIYFLCSMMESGARRLV